MIKLYYKERMYEFTLHKMINYQTKTIQYSLVKEQIQSTAEINDWDQITVSLLISILNIRRHLCGKEVLFHVFVEKFSVEVAPDGVVDETLRSLSLTASLVLENHIIIPPEQVEFKVPRVITLCH